MARLIQPDDVTRARNDHGLRQEQAAVARASAQAAALDAMEPDICGNVDFVLFLSGNSTFSVGLERLEE
jgi:hypothetical protein